MIARVGGGAKGEREADSRDRERYIDAQTGCKGGTEKQKSKRGRSDKIKEKLFLLYNT